MNAAIERCSHRVLGLDIRPHQFGYAAIEPPRRLLDFGVTRFGSLRAGGERLSFVMKNLHPGIVVLRRISPHSSRDRHRTRALQSLARQFARRFSAEVVLVSSKQLTECFAPQEAHTKHEVASFLAGTFPDLAWYLPHRRKLWEPEDRRMTIFDAAALAVAYLKLCDKSDKKNRFQ